MEDEDTKLAPTAIQPKRARGLVRKAPVLVVLRRDCKQRNWVVFLSILRDIFEQGGKLTKIFQVYYK